MWIINTELWDINFPKRRTQTVKKQDSCLLPYTKINSKRINCLNLQPNTIKLMEENIRNTLQDVRVGKDF